MLAAQIKSFLQKISLSSQDTENVLAALEQDEKKANEEARTEAEILKEELSQIETKLEKLLNLYLSDALSTDEYAAKKNCLVSEKATLTEKIADIVQRGVSWIEPAREFVKSLNQAANLVRTDNLSELPTFLKNIGSNHVLRNREFHFEPKIQYARAAEHRETASSDLQFPFWCRILELVRTHRAFGAAQPPPKMQAAKPHR